MKRCIQILTFLLSNIILNGQEFQSPKPGITINGSAYLVQNTIWSCVPVDCDSFTIMQGDSIEFCTYQQIFLNTDTAYWMEWIFAGCDNMGDTTFNNYPTSTPLCYNPRWNIPGIYNVRIRYNGWLSAYPSSDCYAQGPSQWNVVLIVQPDPNGIAAVTRKTELQIYPQPATDVVHIKGELPKLIVLRDCRNVIVAESEASSSVNVSNLPNGIYVMEIHYDTGEVTYNKLSVRH